AEDGIRDKLVTGVQTCALPIYRSLPPWRRWLGDPRRALARPRPRALHADRRTELEGERRYDRRHGYRRPPRRPCAALDRRRPTRSEEHTSELQSLAYLVCRLLL